MVGEEWWRAFGKLLTFVTTPQLIITFLELAGNLMSGDSSPHLPSYP